MPYPMKKKEKQVGNITETGHFEKLAEIEELSNRLEEIDTDIDIQWALRCIEDDHLEGWDGTEEDHDDLRDILDITVTCLEVE